MQHIATQVTNHGASVDHSCRSVLETAELLAGKYRDTNITQPAKGIPPWTDAIGCRKSPRGKDSSATALQTEVRWIVFRYRQFKVPRNQEVAMIVNWKHSEGTGWVEREGSGRITTIARPHRLNSGLTETR